MPAVAQTASHVAGSEVASGRRALRNEWLLSCAVALLLLAACRLALPPAGTNVQTIVSEEGMPIDYSAD